MKIYKRFFAVILALAMVLGLLPAAAVASDAGYVYISITEESEFLRDTSGKPLSYTAVPLKALSAIDLEDYGLSDYIYDGNGDTKQDITALHLFIYTHERILGLSWDDVDPYGGAPSSMYFSSGLFGFEDENMRYNYNGKYPADEYGWGFTADRIVLSSGDFLEVGHFEDFFFYMDSAYGFRYFTDAEDAVLSFEAEVNVPFSAKLSLVSGGLGMAETLSFEEDSTVYYGHTVGEKIGTVVTDAEGSFDITFPSAGTWYIWSDSGFGEDYACGSVVTTPASAKVIVSDTQSEKEPIPDKNLRFNTSISVGAEMQVFYTIPIANIRNFESFYLEVVKEVAGGESVSSIFSPEEENMITVTHPTSGALTGYHATYTGIYASEMGDSFTATLYAVKEDGTICCSEPVTASIKSYLFDKIADSTSSAELKTLAVDMLNYGAAAQIFFDYDTENLVNADLSEEQKALATQSLPEASNSTLISGTGCNIATNVSLQSKVLLYLTCMYPANDNSNLKFVVKDPRGKILEEFAPILQTATACQGLYSNVGARQMRELLTIELYDNDELVSKSLIWSVESYVAATRENPASSEALIHAVNAMLVYGDSAAAYLTASGQ